MSLEVKEKKIPNIFWYQTNENVIFDVHIHNLDKDIIEIKDNNFKINDDFYSMEFSLFGDVIDDNTEYKVFERYLRIVLKKKDEDNFWKYLSKENIYKNNIKVNWDNWKDEDDDLSENGENNVDFEQMMANMGGMPGMEGMGGMPGMEGMPDMEGMDDDDMEGMDDDDMEDMDNEIHESEDKDCCTNEKCCETLDCCEDENNKCDANINCGNEKCCENFENNGDSNSLECIPDLENEEIQNE